MKLLLTGGAGFIGSHTWLSLFALGIQPIIIDNLSNSSRNMLNRLAIISGQKPIFYEGDIRDRILLKNIFSKHQISSVIHFAGLKAVGESVREPLQYYDNNVSGSLILFEEMAKADILNIVFSSTATVYNETDLMPIHENMNTGDTTNPYATSKYMIERILNDVHKSDPRWSVVILRYFNPIGAHPSGKIGEYPNGIPNNLMPYICQVATNKLPQLSIFGDDYPTPDGTGVRDYIHVMDLAEGHLAAMQRHSKDPGVHIYNLGSGQGHSVLEVIQAFEKASGVRIPYQIAPRRSGDIAEYYADPSKAFRQLRWKAKRDLSTMMADAWRWQSQNPNGYDEA